MKIAIPCENGAVYPHFGKTRAFRIYNIADGHILSAETLNTDGTGHEALAAFLSAHGVDTVICGGLGAGMQDALDAAGISVCSGAEGACDDACEAWLCGELRSAGVNCDHHDHEHSAEPAPEAPADVPAEEPAEGGCGGNCGSCGGCCGAPAITGKNVGHMVKTHYRGTFNDGTVFDSSYDRGEPLAFLCGAGQMIPGYDQAVANMNPGESADVHLMPEDAYGAYDPDAVITANIADLPGSENLSVGEQVYLQTPEGYPVPVRVTEKNLLTITLDANHEMAGKELNFHIELIEVE